MARKRFDFGAGQTVIINGKHLHILSGRCVVEQRVKQGERFLKVNGKRRKKLTKTVR